MQSTAQHKSVFQKKSWIVKKLELWCGAAWIAANAGSQLSIILFWRESYIIYIIRYLPVYMQYDKLFTQNSVTVQKKTYDIFAFLSPNLQ